MFVNCGSLSMDRCTGTRVLYYSGRRVWSVSGVKLHTGCTTCVTLPKIVMYWTAVYTLTPTTVVAPSYAPPAMYLVEWSVIYKFCGLYFLELAIRFILVGERFFHN